MKLKKNIRKIQDKLTINTSGVINGAVQAFSSKGSYLIEDNPSSIEWSNWNNIGETLTLQSLNGTDWVASGSIDNLTS